MFRSELADKRLFVTVVLLPSLFCVQFQKSLYLDEMKSVSTFYYICYDVWRGLWPPPSSDASNINMSAYKPTEQEI